MDASERRPYLTLGSMQTRQLGQTDLHITPIGFGAWAIGGEWLFGWGPQDDADSIAAIRQAVAEACQEAPSVVVLLNPGGLPKTSSGKVQRSACRTRLADGSLDSYAQFPGVQAQAGDAVLASELQSRIAAIWCEQLQVTQVAAAGARFLVAFLTWIVGLNRALQGYILDGDHERGRTRDSPWCQTTFNHGLITNSHPLLQRTNYHIAISPPFQTRSLSIARAIRVPA